MKSDAEIQLAKLLGKETDQRPVDRLYRLGTDLLHAGHAEAALAAFEMVAEDTTAVVPYIWQTITALRQQLKLPRAALVAAQHSVEHTPGSADALYNLGFMLETNQQFEMAVSAYRNALAYEPRHYGALRNAPLALVKCGRFKEAEIAISSSLAAYPDDAELHFNGADLLIGMSAAEQAELLLRKALMLAPDYHRARYGLAIALAAQGKVQDANHERAEALARQPDLIHDYASPLAIDAGQDTHDTRPERVAVISAFEAFRIGDWRRYNETIEMYASLVDRTLGNAPLDQHEMPYCSLSLPLPDSLRLKVARQVTRRVEHEIASMALVRPPRHRDRQLRIGYLSANFRPHPNARLVGNLYARHDRDRFKVYAYSIGPVEESEERHRVIDSADAFRDIGRLPVDAAAQLIANDSIDILVDLSGYTRHARPGILALRPARLQLSYLGYPATMGASFIDYTMLDRQVLPAEVRPYWDEHIAYLPNSSYHCERVQQLPPMPSRAEAGLPMSGLILGALHHPRKIEPITWRCWMSLLERLPETTLWLLYEADEQCEQLRRNAAAYGIAPQRLAFGPVLAQPEHLSRMRLCDIFLDTFVYNGHTTTVDALNAGVPVVTLSGSDVVSRIAGSMLKAHGLPELVASTIDEYQSIVSGLATDASWRQVIRARAQDHSHSKLFCPERKCKQIETAYIMMWTRHAAGFSPQDFDVPPEND